MSTPATKLKVESFEYLPVLELRGVGPSVAEKLTRLDIHCIQDLLFHLPIRYEDRTRVVPIGALQAGQQAVIEGVIEHSEIRYRGKRKGRSSRMLVCLLSDGTGSVVLRFFHFSASQQSNLKNGTRLRCFGESKMGAGRMEIMHPEYQRIDESVSHAVDETLTPVYAKTEGIHQGLLRKLSDQVLERLNNASLREWLPDHLLKKYNFPELANALRCVHRPAPDVSLAAIEAMSHPAQKRLVFEELLAHQLSLVQLRTQIKKLSASMLPLDINTLNAFTGQFGFDLTRAQQKVIKEILADIESEHPMLRLLQGDVGSGKTVVAACAALAALSNGVQVAVMAPTEILARQHYENFSRWFDDDSTPCLLLTGKDKGRPRAQKLDALRSGTAKIIIGTHALFQQDIAFKNLALVIVDEQHRFGVHQRLALREKGKSASHVPHQLIMTATPIPRSLAMTAYADLDYSVIDELPRGRKPVATVVVSDRRRQEVIDRVAEACAQGEQAYWVCTLVEESELLQCQAAEDTAAQLTHELAHLSIGLVHGRMRQQDKDEMVLKFKNAEIDLLVATTVIEVGVDVPAASLMVIENAERLGLSQLHQLRGRVGRGDKQSSCVLMYRAPLSAQGKARLAVLRETHSGFVVAQKDLEMRGPGEMLGTRQTGLMQMRIADIVRDEKLLPDVKAASELLMQHSPASVAPLIRRWLGRADRFGSV